MKAETIRGTYGSALTPCNVIIATLPDGSTWYAVEDSANVNRTWETPEDGVNVETVEDFDTFTWPDGIDSEETLIEAIEA